MSGIDERDISRVKVENRNGSSGRSLVISRKRLQILVREHLSGQSAPPEPEDPRFGRLLRDIRPIF